MPLAVVLSPAAARDLDALDVQRRSQVVRDLEAFAQAPQWEPPAVKRLKGYLPPLHRLRSGDFRVLFRLERSEMRVYRVIDRKNLERALKRIR